MGNEINIGRLIKDHVEKRGIRIGWLAKQLLCHRNTIYNIFERDWIDTQTLMRISLLLRHDFFADFSKYYRSRVDEDNDDDDTDNDDDNDWIVR